MAIAVVHANAGTIGTESGTLTVQALTLTQAAADDETVIIGVSGASGVGELITSVTDDGPGRTWTVDVAEYGSPLGNADAWVIRGARGGGAMSAGDTITITWAGDTYVRSMAASVFSGFATSSVVADTATDTVVDPAATGWASGTIDIPAGGMAFAVAMTETGAVTNTITSPSVEATDFQIASAPTTQTTAYRLSVGGDTGVTIAGTWSSAVKSTIVAASYNSDGGGGPDPEPTAFLKWGGVLVPSVVQTKFDGVLYPGL